MAMPILSTKLSLPPLRTRLVRRARLTQKLNQGVECGFVLVSAPAGYGKTTLLSTWLRQLELATAWVTLDERDNEPIRFLTYLANALDRIKPSLGAVLGSSLQVVQLPGIEILLTPWINELNQIEHPFWVVLDDYHLVQNQVIHQIIGFLLEHRPPSFHLAIATRADPPLPLSRLRARAQMVELRSADLRFSMPEMDEFLSGGMGLSLSEVDLALLEASTEGWAAGIQMAGLSLQGREDASNFIRSFSGENRYILDFLFEEVFQRQPEKIQNFLLHTAILERLCAALCDAVTGQDNSREILDSLERSNLFVTALDEPKTWYRYHPLFASLLKSRLKQVTPDPSGLLHRRASAWYAAQNTPEKAVVHAFAVPDYDLASQLIEQAIEGLDLVNQQALLTSWVDRIPKEILMNYPWLCAIRAYGYYWTGRRELAEEWLEAAEEASQHTFEPDSAAMRYVMGYIAAVRTHTSLLDEDILVTQEMAHQALSLLPEGNIMRCTTSIALGVVYWALGDVQQSIRAFEASRDTALKMGNSIVVSPICYLALQQIKQGRLQDAQASLTSALNLATLPGGDETPIAGFANVRLGDIHRQRNELAMAAQHLSRGVAQCAQLLQVDFLTDAYVCLGRYQLALGDFKGAFASLQRADWVAKQSRVDQWVLCWLDDLRLKAWLAVGDLNAATRWAQSSGLSLDEPLSYLHDLHHINLARVLVAQGALTGSCSASEQASTLLERLQIAAEKAGWVHELIHILVLQAINHRASRRTGTALNKLAQAVSLAEPGGYVRVFLDEGKIIQDLLMDLAKSIRDQTLPESSLNEQGFAKTHKYIHSLLASFSASTVQTTTNSTAPTPPRQAPSVFSLISTQNQALLEPLSAREIEVLHLLAQGYPDKKIAEILVIARETVHKHLKNIYGKLDVHNRTEAVARARNLGLL